MDPTNANILIVDGLEVAERFKADSKTHHVPIIIITENNGADLLSRGLGSCADDFISKTADPSEIIARIEYHVKRKRMLDQLQSDHLDFRTPYRSNPANWPSP